MKEIVKKIIKEVLVFVRDILEPTLDEVVVLCYHAIDDFDDWDISTSPDDFKKQIRYLLDNNYYFARPNEISEYISGRKDLPNKSVLITFDDAYESVYTNAFPILKKNKIPFIVFKIVDFEVSRDLRQTDRKEVSVEQLKEMQESGLMTLGHHGKTHKMHDSLERTEMLSELESDYKYFAYPGGHSTKESQRIVSEKYELGFSISPGLLRKGDRPNYLKRNVVLRNMNMNDFKFITTKAVDWYSRFVKRFR